jgi:glutaredoxin-like protein
MLASREGQKVPKVVFRTREGDSWKDVRSEDVFDNSTVVVFSLPGAFTPTCSSTHLPRYNELASVFKQNGVDEIVCVSVNDAFVMQEWQKSQHAENVMLLPDGNGEFTEGMGMLVDKRNLGFGQRSWRYSMLVKNGVVEKMFIEPEKEGDPFEVSDADTMLRHVNPAAKAPDFVTLFTRPGCPHCARAKKALAERSFPYEEIVIGKDVTTRSLRAVTGAGTVPQVFVGGKLIGSADELERWLARRDAEAA